MFEADSVRLHISAIWQPGILQSELVTTEEPSYRKDCSHFDCNQVIRSYVHVEYEDADR